MRHDYHIWISAIQAVSFNLHQFPPKMIKFLHYVNEKAVKVSSQDAWHEVGSFFSQQRNGASPIQSPILSRRQKHVENLEKNCSCRREVLELDYVNS